MRTQIRVKREAAEEYPHDVESYMMKKNELIEQARERGREAGYKDYIDL